MKPIEAAVFDLEGTLFNSPQLSQAHHRSVIQLIATRNCIPISKAKSEFDRTKTELAQTIGYDPPLVAVVSKLGLDRKAFYGCIERTDPSPFLHPDSNVKEALRCLKRFCKTGLLTNMSKRITKNILMHLGLSTALFDAISCGDDVCENKPSYEPFLRQLL